MQPTRTQKWLSQIKDIHFETASSEYNEVLHVVLSKGRFQLLTNNAIYSYGDLYTNYKRAFDKVNLKELDIENVLILGFGMGSIPYMIEHLHQKKLHYTAVEIDETVIYLAHKYVTQYLESPIEVIEADAFAYVMQAQGQFDLICMDVFIDDQVPLTFERLDFLEQLKSLLGENGILMFNRLYLTKTDRRSTRSYYENTFLKVFEDGDFMDVGGNWIMTNRKLIQ